MCAGMLQDTGLLMCAGMLQDTGLLMCAGMLQDTGLLMCAGMLQHTGLLMCAGMLLLLCFSYKFLSDFSKQMLCCAKDGLRAHFESHYFVQEGRCLCPHDFKSQLL
jgi:hypothetical protein